MYNLYIPLCGLILNIILLILYKFKVAKIKGENRLYFVMLIDTLVMTIFCMAAVYLIYIDYNQSLIKLTNKIECFAIVNYFMNLFMYIGYICKLEQKQLKIFYLVLNIILFLSVFLTPVSLKVTNDLTYMVSIGLSVDITTFVSGIFIVATFILSIKNRKKLQEKMIPVTILLIFIVIVVLVRGLVPEFICLEFLATVAMLIMYHTIENPNMKMLNEVMIAKDHAEKANRAKSDFLSSMSHEIRNPLNAIVGLSEDIASFKDQVPKQVVEDTEDIQNASQTLLEIVGNILDINKIESEKMEIVENPYNFREEITNMCKVTSTRIGEKNINFKLQIADDMPYELIGDRVHVKQIVNNLLSNAIKYTEQGQVILSIKCVNDFNKNISNIIITCQDTGRGIKPEYISKLFTKFERLDIEKNSTTEGTGLGLAITKALVEMMGGKINVSSQFGQGSIFMVQIPQKISKIEKPTTEQQLSDTSSNLYSNLLKQNTSINKNNLSVEYGNKKVLIVDDNNLNIKVAKRALDPFNFEIDECNDGQQCLDKITAGNVYDLILMDIMMPVMSGETALAKLKENPNFRTPVIALTADAVAGAKEKYISKGFVDYIAKPFNKDQIKEKLDIVFANNSNNNNENNSESQVEILNQNEKYRR